MIARVYSLVSGLTAWGLFLRTVTIVLVIMAVTRVVPVRPGHQNSRRRRTPSLRPWSASLLAALVVITVLAYMVGYVPRNSRSSSVTFSQAFRERRLSQRGPYLGVFEPGEFGSYQNVVSFGRRVRHRPNIILYYSAWNTPFQTNFAKIVAISGATPYVVLEPNGITMTAIANGRCDSYLRSYANEVRDYGAPVILTFAPEANGPWYSWGWSKTSAKTWVAAWKLVVSVFRQQHAANVTWMWVMNRSSPGTGPVRDYWPGSSYVNWVGIDGYYFQHADTFGKILAPTIKNIRAFTHRPILLSEVGIGQVAGQARKIPELFSGIRRYHLIGLVWFDMAQHGDLYHQDWRLEGDPAGLAAFRRGVASMFVAG